MLSSDENVWGILRAIFRTMLSAPVDLVMVHPFRGSIMFRSVDQSRAGLYRIQSDAEHDQRTTSFVGEPALFDGIWATRERYKLGDGGSTWSTGACFLLDDGANWHNELGSGCPRPRGFEANGNLQVLSFRCRFVLFLGDGRGGSKVLFGVRETEVTGFAEKHLDGRFLQRLEGVKIDPRVGVTSKRNRGRVKWRRDDRSRERSFVPASRWSQLAVGKRRFKSDVRRDVVGLVRRSS